MPEGRRFPPPWTVEERPTCFIIKDATGQALAYVCYDEEHSRRAEVQFLTHEEGRRLADNLAKLPNLLQLLELVLTKRTPQTSFGSDAGSGVLMQIKKLRMRRGG